ncbi:hypothetical protein O181_067099 [Austropuccinia psidii MF-1]|uniref:Hydrophobin n=1 Tax=Austropuccinia psidii MF-1 TaxID=1389203 RepID=A0A9Q3EU90_9BASI|nr:hypothetical protein [Austropuccinia psidii MF-1]
MEFKLCLLLLLSALLQLSSVYAFTCPSGNPFPLCADIHAKKKLVDLQPAAANPDGASCADDTNACCTMNVTGQITVKLDFYGNNCVEGIP